MYNADETGLFFNCLLERRDLPWRKKWKGAADGITVYKQQWLRQISAHRYWKVHETTVFQKYKEATCDLLCQLESVDDVEDFQILSAYS